MLSSPSSTQHQNLFKKLSSFFLIIFSLFSRLFKSLFFSLSSAMDDIFDPGDFLSVDFDADSDHSRRRRRRLDYSSSVSLRNDRLFLVSYQWWNDARNECFVNGGDFKGVRYTVSSLKGDDDDDDEKDCDEIVVNLKRENDEDKGEGVSGRDYALITESMWYKALKWHSEYCTRFKDIGCSLAEQDVFPIQIRLYVMTNSLVVKIFLMDNPFQFYKRAYQIFDVQPDPVHIWDFSGQMSQFVVDDDKLPNGCPGEAIEEVHLELQVYGLPNIQNDLVRESEIAVQGRYISGGSCCRRPVKMNGIVESQCSSPSSSSQICSRSYGETGVLGLAGLLNLGNTCFMNSAIQCLAHTPALVDYFLGDFKKEINYENPLGMNGELALAFGDLLRKLWAPGGMAVAPRLFKSTLESFAPQFCGYNQHDSQEFLAFLLDGLHEDLNRVKHKPYIQVDDTERHPDDNMADEYWQNHLARNDSIIVDLFHGQFRSTLVCPLCKRVSITFDPFMYLSLPLPSTTMRTMTVTLLNTDGSMLPSPLTVTVPKFGTWKDLIEALSSALSLRDDETLFVAEIYNNCIIRYLEDPSDSLELIRDNDSLVSYILPKESENSQLVVFMHQQVLRNSSLQMSRPSWSLFGIPFVARISNIADGTQIRDTYLKLLRPFLIMDECDYDDTENSDNDLAKMESGTSSNSDNSSAPDDLMGAGLHAASDFLFQFTNKLGIFEGQRIELGKPLDVCSATDKLYVLVSWTEEIKRRYDTSRLGLLPEVFKPGFLDSKAQEAVSVSKCLEGFLKEEPLGPDDMWYCPNCKQHCQAIKKLDLWRLPEILVVHLKRFSYSCFLKNKLETYIDFPTDKLDLTGFLAHQNGPSSNCYRLYAISNHYGSMGGGHYTALVCHGDRWYEFDDSVVELVQEDIKTSAAYVLFYRRISDIKVS